VIFEDRAIWSHCPLERDLGSYPDPSELGVALSFFMDEQCSLGGTSSAQRASRLLHIWSNAVSVSILLLSAFLLLKVTAYCPWGGVGGGTVHMPLS
jgi:hypothetical protein